MGRPAADVGPLDEARERLVEAHLDLVDFRVELSVRRFPGLTFDEARSVGLLALVEVAASYDEGRGDFAPYAKTWIEGASKKAASTLHPDRVAAQSGPTLEQVLAGEHPGTRTPGSHRLEARSLARAQGTRSRGHTTLSSPESWLHAAWSAF